MARGDVFLGGILVARPHLDQSSRIDGGCELSGLVKAKERLEIGLFIRSELESVLTVWFLC